jgi:glycopeptide antibiotics resistance protein
MKSYSPPSKSIYGLIVCAYFLALVYFHDLATVAADWLKYALSLRIYNLALLTSVLGMSFALAVWIYRYSRRFPERRIFFILFLVTAALMVMTVFTMMVVNMEAIHFIQFAVLAVLIFPLVRRYDDAFIYASVLGMVDETYQYLVLNPDFKYYDFNDLVLNMIGAGAGLLVLASVRMPDIKPPRKWHRSPAVWFVAGIIALGLIFSAGFPVSFYPSDQPGHWFSLYRTKPGPEYWTYLYDRRYYHILRPWEGIAYMIALTLFYTRIDPISRKLKTNNTVHE